MNTRLYPFISHELHESAPFTRHSLTKLDKYGKTIVEFVLKKVLISHSTL